MPNPNKMKANFGADYRANHPAEADAGGGESAEILEAAELAKKQEVAGEDGVEMAAPGVAEDLGIPRHALTDENGDYVKSNKLRDVVVAPKHEYVDTVSETNTSFAGRGFSRIANWMLRRARQADNISATVGNAGAYAREKVGDTMEAAKQKARNVGKAALNVVILPTIGLGILAGREVKKVAHAAKERATWAIQDARSAANVARLNVRETVQDVKDAFQEGVLGAAANVGSKVLDARDAMANTVNGIREAAGNTAEDAKWAVETRVSAMREALLRRSEDAKKRRDIRHAVWADRFNKFGQKWGARIDLVRETGQDAANKIKAGWNPESTANQFASGDSRDDYTEAA